jgi:hypothetical protein
LTPWFGVWAAAQRVEKPNARSRAAEKRMQFSVMRSLGRIPGKF